MALTTDLVSYYKLDESSGNAADSVGSNTGTNNNVTYSTGKINNGAVFNGTNAYLSMADSEDWNFGTGDFTISFWYKSAGNDANYDTWIAQENTASNLWCIDMGVGGNKPRFVSVNSDTTVAEYNITDAQTFTSGTWYMITVVRNGTSILMYKDASSKSLTTTTAISTNAIPNIAAAMVIGYRPTQGRYIDGMMDEVSIWKRDLSADEITELYNSGSGNQYPFLKPLIADVGAFTLTGIDVNFNVALTMIADAGAFVLTGIDASIRLLVNYVMTAGTGAFSLVGQAINFVVKAWTRETKPTSSYTNDTKPTSSWNNDSL